MVIDHRDIANHLDLFHFEEESPGMIFWHPQGFKIFNKIQDYMRQKHKQYGYKEIKTPIMLNKSLWEKSGHWDKFGDNIFVVPAENQEKQTYALKPMSCPAHIQIYRKGIKSYNMLPDRYFEFGIVHRNEPSGSLLSAMRLRQFTQDDAHLFCTEYGILDEIKNYIKMLREVYKDFGFNEISVKLATRPDQRIGADNLWDKAEAALEKACVDSRLSFTINHGEGAFYGPKLEFTLQDNLHRDWQCGTIQIDFNMAERLGAYYIDEQGQRQSPVLIHHAVLGSLERWIGILLEHYDGHLPLWLAPTQIVVASIVNDVDDHALKIYKWLQSEGLEVEFDDRGEKIGKKIRDAQALNAPYMAIIGKKEKQSDTATGRRSDGSQSPIHEVVQEMHRKILEKS